MRHVEPVEILPGRLVGPGHPALVIAEAGINHNGEVGRAIALAEAAAAAGADCVKFQTYDSGAVVSIGAPKANYQTASGISGESQLDMVKRFELKPSDFQIIATRCRDLGVTFLSTPFDDGSVDLLMDLGVPAIKIGSGDLTNKLLLRRVAETGLPVILSTGMASLAEVETAVGILDIRQSSLILMHCVSAYPTPAGDANLRAIDTLVQTLGFPTGFSDHTLGIEVALAAVARGACAVEKHFTLDPNDHMGPDHGLSLDPSSFETLVAGIRTIESALGDGRKVPRPSEVEIRDISRRSLFAGRDIPAGTILTENNVVALRPGTGIPVAEIDSVLGRTTRHVIPAGTQISLGQLT